MLRKKGPETGNFMKSGFYHRDIRSLSRATSDGSETSFRNYRHPGVIVPGIPVQWFVRLSLLQNKASLKSPYPWLKDLIGLTNVEDYTIVRTH